MKNLNPHLSVDCVIFGVENQQLKVLLVDREFSGLLQGSEDPNRLKLPGGLVYNDELLSDAATRILQELTGIQKINLHQFDVLDSLNRMGNQADRIWLEKLTGLSIERVVSIAYYGIVDVSLTKSNNENSHWVEMKDIHNLPFDHEDIIQRALITLRQSLKRDGLVFSYLPEKFTINQLQSLISVFYGEEPDSRNFRKKIKKLDFIVPLNEKQINVAHKPAQLYRFDPDKFSLFSNNRIIF
jgi:hypothetical protein